MFDTGNSHAASYVLSLLSFWMVNYSSYRNIFCNYNRLLEIDLVLDLNFLFPWPRLFFLFSTMTQRIVKRLVSYHISHEDLFSVKLATRAR